MDTWNAIYEQVANYNLIMYDLQRLLDEFGFDMVEQSLKALKEIYKDTKEDENG